MEPPEGCPPLAGWKRHACHSPPQPVFCPDRPCPLAPGCAAKPHYTVLDRAELPSKPCAPIGSNAVKRRLVARLRPSGQSLAIILSWKSVPVNQKRTLDSVQITVYNKHKERCCRQTVSPFECAEITASLCEGGGYFFFVASNTRATTPRITRQNWNSSAYVTISITPFLQGGPTACNRMWQHLVLILPWRCFPVKKKGA